MVVVVTAPSQAELEEALDRARPALEELAGISPIWRQDCHALPNEKEPFGFRDGISHPAGEGSGIPGSNLLEEPLKAGEFVLGYRDEMGGFPPQPEPAALGRNGTYIVFRKLHQRVAEFRRFLKSNAADADDEELIAAKMMGRWRSGAPRTASSISRPSRAGWDWISTWPRWIASDGKHLCCWISSLPASTTWKTSTRPAAWPRCCANSSPC